MTLFSTDYSDNELIKIILLLFVGIMMKYSMRLFVGLMGITLASIATIKSLENNVSRG